MNQNYSFSSYIKVEVPVEPHTYKVDAILVV